MSLPGQKVSRDEKRITNRKSREGGGTTFQLPEKSPELPTAPEGMKWLGKCRYDTQLWMCLMMKVKPDAAKNSIV